MLAQLLNKYVGESERAVRETCESALAKINADHSEEGQKHWSTTAKQAEE